MQSSAFTPVPSVGSEETEANTIHARTLGLRHIERAGHVAVVGGGLSLADHLDALRAWNGPIWAVNQAFMWLKARGVRSTFVTADPKPQAWLRVEPGDTAYVCLHASPALFEALEPAHVTTYRLALDEIHCGTTTATAMAYLAPYIGHQRVSFFGCDSSFGAESHVWDCEMVRDRIVVRCGGSDFITKPEFLMQCEALASLCREIPEVYTSRSNGLLSAMVASPDYEITAASRWLLESMQPDLKQPGGSEAP